MMNIVYLLTIAVMLCTASTIVVGAEESDRHEHHDASLMEIAGPEEGRWETDASLRRGMNRIRTAVNDRLDAFNEDRLTAEEATVFAQKIDESVNYMVANCKLDPEPDAALHVLLAVILSGKHKMLSDPMHADGMPRIIDALDRYPRLFEHSGWQPLTN